MNPRLNVLSILFILSSCGEEVLTQNTLDTQFQSNKLESFEINTCAQMTFKKPPVDILYVIDNSGSTTNESFQSIKGEIQKTIATISSNFDYHIYFAPLHPGINDSIQAYPLMVSDPEGLANLASVNITSPENLNMFASPQGNNQELGFQRVKSLILNNRLNNIFRDQSNTIVVMISNGDDTQALKTANGNKGFDPYKFEEIKSGFLEFTQKYTQNHIVTNPMNAKNFRFISLVAHSSCNGWQRGANYQMMSRDVYNYQGLSDSSEKDSFDLCSKSYSHIFKALNKSIQALIIGHKYDHWKISSANEADIQTDDIIVTKIKEDGSKENIKPGPLNGFEYLGFKTNQPVTYEPEQANEKSTGLIIKLNGDARVSHPDCIIAKTRTPTEYFGYFAIPREPDLSTVKIEIAGKAYPQSASNGWSYMGHRDILNIKVPGPTKASVLPALNKSGYFIKLSGDAIFTNGESIKVFYKPKAK